VEGRLSFSYVDLDGRSGDPLCHRTIARCSSVAFLLVCFTGGWDKGMGG